MGNRKWKVSPRRDLSVNGDETETGRIMCFLKWIRWRSYFFFKYVKIHDEGKDDNEFKILIISFKNCYYVILVYNNFLIVLIIIVISSL